MENKYVVGNVVLIDGLKVIVKMLENTNMLTYFYKDKIYKGVSIGEYLGIIRGPYKIVAKVEKEYLEDVKKDYSNQISEEERYVRKVELKVIGYIINGKFKPGIKFLPMIYNEVILLDEEEIFKAIKGDEGKYKYTIPFGKILKEDINMELPWNLLFNTHIGIFGNTGSGKSNTLTKLYTELFKLQDKSIINLKDRSKFIIIDFNGEYTKEDVITKNKNVIELSTKLRDGKDKIKLAYEKFFDIETLSIIFSATEKTQQPFLKNALNHFKSDWIQDTNQIITSIGTGFYNVFKANNNKESLSLLNKVLEIIKFSKEDISDVELKKWLTCLWHSKNNTFYYDNNIFINNKSEEEILNVRSKFESGIVRNNDIQNINFIDKLKIMIYLQLIYGLRYQCVQFDHINPLLQRIESRSKFLNKLIEIDEEESDSFLDIISLRDCNQEAKKIIPLLIAKQNYELHKKSINPDKLDKTFHIIIDEAHNILSEQSTREEETWKDYRLEVFEEIIKEGRKFGFYMTIASQRPYDISPTIMSQIHNYFLHRLVNELDLRMISNTINTLDSLSKDSIPNLAPGQCVLTGTIFEPSILVQVDKLEKSKMPNSDNADLYELWFNKN